MGEQMRTLSARKLGEVEALLERTRAMQGWLEVAQRCGCATPDGVRALRRAGAGKW